jgi:hypothetical protein
MLIAPHFPKTRIPSDGQERKTLKSLKKTLDPLFDYPSDRALESKTSLLSLYDSTIKMAIALMGLTRRRIKSSFGMG